ncbi:MAG: uracil-DNA glycosylase [Proteobacteria bacterium]|nr:uracil-DNA glycosylase [Pseudomonadota bacterium]
MYFYITYDPQFPYGCRAARFKSRRLPAKEMSASSGMDCQFFAGKEKNI